MLWEHTESAKHVKGSRANVDTVMALGRGGHAFQESDSDRQAGRALNHWGHQDYSAFTAKPGACTSLDHLLVVEAGTAVAASLPQLAPPFYLEELGQ